MPTIPTPNPDQAPDPQALERLRQLVERAQRGDPEVLPELRAALDAYPALWRHHGDLARHTEEAWLRLISGDNLLLRESVRRQAEELRAELAGPQASPLERQLSERVAACWLQTQYADTSYAQFAGRGATPAQRAEAQQRQNSSQQRYLLALKALATVRKLLKPMPSVFDLGLHPVAETVGVPHQRSNLTATTPAGAPVRN
jgi:hypothetical protein